MKQGFELSPNLLFLLLGSSWLEPVRLHSAALLAIATTIGPTVRRSQGSKAGSKAASISSSCLHAGPLLRSPETNASDFWETLQHQLASIYIEDFAQSSFAAAYGPRRGRVFPGWAINQARVLLHCAPAPYLALLKRHGSRNVIVASRRT